jgi:hypothetical protein
MATDLTTIFGNEIKVGAQPRDIDRQYAGLAGAHGLLAMHMGTRGRRIVVTGTLASSGVDYAAARANLQDVIDGIEAYTYPGVAAADYSFFGETYNNVVFDRFQLVPDSDGRFFHWTSSGYATCSFICLLRQLI